MHSPRQFREGPEDERHIAIRSIREALALHYQPTTANGDAEYVAVSGEQIGITRLEDDTYYIAFFQATDSLRPAKAEIYRVEDTEIGYCRVTATTNEDALTTSRELSKVSQSYHRLPDEDLGRLTQFFRSFEDKVLVTERTLMQFAEKVEAFARRSLRPVPPDEEVGGELVSVERYRAEFQADQVAITAEYALYQSATASKGEFKDFVVITREPMDGVEIVATYAYEDDTDIAARAVHAEPLPGTPANAVPTFSADESAFTELAAKRLLALMQRAKYVQDYHREYAPDLLDRAPQRSTSLAIERILMGKIRDRFPAWKGEPIVEWVGPVQDISGAPQQLRITYFKRTTSGAGEPNAPFFSLIWTGESGEEEFRVYRTGGMQKVLLPPSAAHVAMLPTGQPAFNERAARQLLKRLQRQLG